jgi:peptidoglycan hydrolase-like protein with peptidoglycan-binding domain
VIALIGAIPMYRDLSAGDTGIDVKQLESNLAKLGYDGFDVDREFTYYTGLAVKEWQEDVGLEESGVVAQSDVVFIPAGGLVATVHAVVGSALTPGAAVLDIRGSEQVVSLEVDVADRDLMEVGTEVTVRLAGSKEAAGTVTEAAVVESSSDDGASDDGGSGEGSGSDDAVAEVEVTLNESVDNALLGSPVDVVVAVDEREDVLVVPVTALLALSEGGYGLEVVADDGTTSIVPVEVGLFADGQVAVSAEGIDEGTVVGVAGR